MYKGDKKGKTLRHTTKIVSILVVRLVHVANKFCGIIVQITGLQFWYKKKNL
jgi:cytochrome b subunit of formate dehydrogenase